MMAAPDGSTIALCPLEEGKSRALFFFLKDRVYVVLLRGCTGMTPAHFHVIELVDLSRLPRGLLSLKALYGTV
jgi:hypothetical protein